jgi:phospholipid/cholesterol/gamma-HCH transport system permease protein
MMEQKLTSDLVQLDTEYSLKDVLTFRFSGRLDTQAVATLWEKSMNELGRGSFTSVVIDAGKLNYCNGSGAALIIAIKNKTQALGKNFELINPTENIQTLTGIMDFKSAPTIKSREYVVINFVISTGRQVGDIFRDIVSQISFIGEFTAAIVYMVKNPRKMRWKDVFATAESAGANALGIIMMLGFLLGLILAFQSAIPLRRFGAQIYVADLVAISVIRELGPLITAIILAGRSSSAFAAEIGTMKINEEIDALTTMGLDPVRFLTVSKVLAAMTITPLLTIFANIFALVGCGVVMLSLGFPMITYILRVQASVSVGDLFGGLFKSLVFGLLVAAVGCLRGLQTQSGASAVGQSATRAVVSSIILIVLADGIFAVLFYYLGI